MTKVKFNLRSVRDVSKIKIQKSPQLKILRKNEQILQIFGMRILSVHIIENTMKIYFQIYKITPLVFSLHDFSYSVPRLREPGRIKGTSLKLYFCKLACSIQAFSQCAARNTCISLPTKISISDKMRDYYCAERRRHIFLH